MALEALISAVEAIDEVEVFGRVKTVQGLLIEVVGPVRELRVGGRVIIETTAAATSSTARSSAFATGTRSACRSGRSPACGSAAARCSRATTARSIQRQAGSAGWSTPTANRSTARGRSRMARSLMTCGPRRRRRTTACGSGRRSISGCARSTPSPRSATGSVSASSAGSGVGKSVLMSMLTRNAAVDVTVVGLIGERGREVKEFIADYLGRGGDQERGHRRRDLGRERADAAAGGLSHA